jgi:hypothetical protein
VNGDKDEKLPEDLLVVLFGGGTALPTRHEVIPQTSTGLRRLSNKGSGEEIKQMTG